MNDWCAIALKVVRSWPAAALGMGIRKADVGEDSEYVHQGRQWPTSRLTLCETTVPGYSLLTGGSVTAALYSSSPYCSLGTRNHCQNRRIAIDRLKGDAGMARRKYPEELIGKSLANFLDVGKV